MISKDPFVKITDALKEAGNYRVFNDVLREAGNFPRTIWYSKYGIKNVINWCANDYLGMAQHKVVLDAMHTALDKSGAGSGGTRNISGTTHYHVCLITNNIKHGRKITVCNAGEVISIKVEDKISSLPAFIVHFQFIRLLPIGC